ncbi:23S rRNA (pseudouridine(1915)-N(3))-methyltransferase RlmH [Caldicellulosiruptor acetigenus]|uniref:23S rRNA (pseudouridine(1915)-N(3))-methyltransferase RlmH n=1 Tax=Caldicellulosiruptor acetigenus TaxID=301953 RepID=UPI000428E3C2|nr:23S rRNA (pseudouridine(1915)-N(3))-methyltransferase RlmH [Caldicellulosiruptor acetigenus]WAM35329.1 23S rRNA (pseudouridine(1915)-N(3))-methyltransferase RlmH [Caldicellulosiruptor acetigenus]
MIRIISVGTIKEKYFLQACEEYKKRLSRWVKVEEIEIKEEDENKYSNIETLLEKEADKILKHIKKDEFIIACDVNGIEFSSEEFSEILRKNMNRSKDITFIIGSSNGLSNEVKRRADLLLSFSKLTFPHQLFRVLLYEQIYRGLSIIYGTKYHK